MTCRACLSDRLDPVFEMDPMPLAGAFAATREDALAATRYPLTWLLCHDCGLVNVSPDIPDAELYGTYSYAASTVPALVRHHAEFARVLSERYTEPVRLVEIGCNDGVLLNRLPPTWDLIGVDPSNVAVAAYNMPFGEAVEHIGTVDVVTTSNTFAHFTDIAGALRGVARILRPGGEFWIEVHDLASTIATGQWDTVYHEHKVEWSLGALVPAIERHGFDLDDSWTLPLHGGLIRARFVKRPPDWHRVVGVPSFEPLARSYAERRPPALMPHSAAYGAAGRATVYLNQMPGLPIDYVVDGSPLRAGKFMPGVGLPVVSPDAFDQPETTLITAWNHAPDIRARHPGYVGWVSAW